MPHGPLRFADRGAGSVLRGVVERLPRLEGLAIEVRFQPELSAHRGKLLSRGGKGSAVHAGSDMRKRWMVLDSGLKCHPAELERIFLHEIFHFVWVRLGNPARRSYEDLVCGQAGRRGELGWSAEGRKAGLRPEDREERTRRWREYVCESFCDTAAWFYSRQLRHAEWTLGERQREERKRWFGEYTQGHPLFL